MKIEEIEAETLAILFHYMYEVNSICCGYKTRDESAVSWDDVPELNKKVMIRTAEDVLKFLARRLSEDQKPSNSEDKEC